MKPPSNRSPAKLAKYVLSGALLCNVAWAGAAQEARAGGTSEQAATQVTREQAPTFDAGERVPPHRAIHSGKSASGKDANATACARRCLLEALTAYTEALVDNDTSRLQLAPSVRVTSNGSISKPGRGEVWGSVKRIPFRHALVDPITGAAVFYGVLTNSPTRDQEKWWFYAVRLKIEDRRIAEVEEVSYDGMLGATPAASLHLPDRLFDTVLPVDERSSRQELFAIANRYFDVVSRTVDYHDVPWHPECERIELGAFTVNSGLSAGSCGGEFRNPRIKWIVRNRRFYIADVERGLVFAIGNFTTPPEYPDNNGSVVFELFKVQDGLIRQIQAFFRGNGQLHSGWGEGPGS